MLRLTVKPLSFRWLVPGLGTDRGPVEQNQVFSRAVCMCVSLVRDGLPCAAAGRKGLLKHSLFRGARVAQSLDCPTLDLGSGLDFMVVSSSPALGSMLLWNLLRKERKTGK